MVRPGLLVLVIAFVLAGCNLASSPPAPTDTPVPAQLGLTCGQLVSQAVQAIGQACNDMGRNQACYGNYLVDAQFKQDVQQAFAAAGDLAALQGIQLISTSPFDELQQTWGVALMKAQANLPDSLPGQNLTFLLYGGAVADSVTPRMEAVILSTGFGAATCSDAPASAALLQSPDGTQVSMNINGADLILGSTLHLTAVANQELIIATIEGEALVSAFGVTRIVPAGAQVRLPLGSTDGLVVVGPPSEIEPFDLNVIQRAPLELLPDRVLIPAPILPTPTETPTIAPLPITPTLPPLIIPLPPTALPPVCFPRTDWVYTYTVQPGDTLFSIAQRFNLTLAQLQSANCIPNANIISVGQVLRVPYPPPPPPPTKTSTPGGIGPTLQPTSTTIPFFPTNTPTDPDFSADSTTISIGDCTMVRWGVQNVDSVLFEGKPTALSGAQEVCPQESERYTLLVIYPDGTQVPYFVSITVEYPIG